MFTPFQVKKVLLPCVITLSAIFSHTASADPVILPPGELNNVPPVFCFKVTGGDELAGGGARIQFEVLNWTGEDAYYVQVQQNPFSAANTGGLFSSTIPNQPNGWHVVDNLFGGELEIGGNPGNVVFSAEQNAGFGLADVPKNPIQGIDLDPNNDLDFSDAPTNLPNPVDSGINVLDGFVLDFPELFLFDRVVLQWTLLNENFQNVDSGFNPGLGGFVQNPFSFGTFQIDRASNGSIRVATYFSIGQNLDDVEAFGQTGSPVNVTETELNAVTLPATVPVPAAVWLFMSGMVGLIGVSRRSARRA